MNRRRLEPLETVASVAVGGLLGSIGRYWVVTVVPGLAGTFLVNVTGSAVLGYVLYTATTTDRFSRRTRLFVATGFLSSYTTYSTFALETAGVDPAVALANVLGSYACGFGAALLGRRIALGGER